MIQSVAMWIHDQLQYANHNQQKLPPWKVVAVLFVLAISTFGLPAVLGLSWWPSWSTSGMSTASGTRNAAYPAALDTWTFGTVAWPLRHVAAQALRHGRLPLWDPNASLGLPLFGRYDSQLLLPSEWLAVLGGPVTWTLLLLADMVLAGFGTYLFLRGTRLADIPALAGAVFYMFSGYFVWFYTVPSFIAEASILPWLFWVVDQRRQGTMGAVRSFAISAFVIGMLLESGQPQVAVLVLLGCALYLVVGALLSPEPLRQIIRLISIIAGVPLGVAVALPQLRLFSEMLHVGYSLHSPGAYSGTAVNVLNLTSMIWPYLLGQLGSPWQSTVNLGSGAARFVQEGFPMMLGAVGLFTMCLALTQQFAIAWGRKNLRGADAAWWSLLVVLYLVLLLLLPPGPLNILGPTNLVQSLWQHSVLNQVNFPRYVVPLLSFLAAAFVAAGTNAVAQLKRWQLLVTSAACLVVVGALLVPVVRIAGVTLQSAEGGYMWDSIVISMVVFVVGLGMALTIAFLAETGRVTVQRAQVAILLVLMAELVSCVRYGLAMGDEYLRLAPFLTVVACGPLVLTRRERLISPVLGAALLATAVILYHAQYGLPRLQDPYSTKKPAYMDFVAARQNAASAPRRLLQTFPYMVPNFPSSLGMANLPTSSPLQIGTTAWYILNTLTDKPEGVPYYLLPNQWWGMSTDPQSALIAWNNYVTRRVYYNLVGVRYIVDAPKGWWSHHQLSHVDEVFRDSEAVVYEDKNALPRAFAVASARRVPDLATAQNMLLTPGINLRRTAIIEAPEGSLPDSILKPGHDDFRPIHIASYTSTLISLNTDFDQPELAILTDAFYPGWTASVDGRQAAIYRVDTIARGVIVPAGKHQVVLSYYPAELSQSLLISAVSLLLCVGLCVPQYRWQQLDARLTSSSKSESVGIKHPQEAHSVGVTGGGRGRVPQWAVVVGSALIVMVVGYSLQVYFGQGLVNNLGVLRRGGEQQERLPSDTSGLRVLYAPGGREEVRPGTTVVGSEGQGSLLSAGDVVWTADGELLRVGAEGRMRRLVGAEGQRVRVVNVGVWDSKKQRFEGLEAVYRGGHWVIDVARMEAANPNSRFQEGTDEAPIPGYWISPGGGGYVITRMKDAGGPFVRVQATQASSYLVVNGQQPLATLDGVPVSIRGEIRAHSAGKATLTLYDVVAADGKAQTYTAQAEAAEQWTMLTVRAQRVVYPDPRDNYSLGVFGVAKGDWFDVREVSLFVGTLP